MERGGRGGGARRQRRACAARKWWQSDRYAAESPRKGEWVSSELCRPSQVGRCNAVSSPSILFLFLTVFIMTHRVSTLQNGE